ncbi:MAG TPA: carboxypeptidase regulatory-like domain-containing protein, partial [Vicinamibacteria bacterium]|nr:carboxypeptidase regulatory-like domain-containing protein [Vicinamibacteria bacterium]
MRLTRWGRIALAVAVAVGLGLVAVAPSGAQTTSASIFGQVKDAQGGVLPGAAVTLTSRTQAYSLAATTDAEGRFVFAIVRPDLYALKITMQGFKTLERTNVQVNANDKFSAGIMTLEVGAITEEVSVTGRVTELQAFSGERSFSLESEAIKNIASNGRQLFNYATLVPGVTSTHADSSEVGQVVEMSVNGQRETSNNVTIDGVANIDTGNNGGNMVTTNTEAIGEFKILTNAYQAEYGRAVGGQVQMVTKSGSQTFHGSGYWFGRRSDWNANTWTNLRAGAPKPVGNGAVIEPPASKRDDYGYTIGGPIYIPGVFNTEKKKLFFFWSQEFEKRTQPPSQHTARVPTALERAGDFSESVDSSGNPFPYIRDYTTGLPCNAGNTSGCFHDGGVLGRIPQNRLYGLGLAALNLFPLPNYTSGGGVNYTSQASDTSSPREDLIRLDFQPSDKWRITGRYMDTKNDTTQAYGTPWAGNGSYQVPMDVLFKNPG